MRHPAVNARQSAAARLAGNPLIWAALLGLLFGVPIFRSVTRHLGASPAILGATAVGAAGAPPRVAWMVIGRLIPAV